MRTSLGQGCPATARLRGNTSPQISRLAVCAVVGVLLALLPVCTDAAASESGMRLRIAWGGGDAQMWHGAIRVPEGRITAFTPLGVAADTAGSFWLDDGVLRFRPRSRRNYEAIDIVVDAPLDSVLDLDIRATSNSSQPSQHLRVVLADLVSKPFDAAVDDRKNRVSVARAPGDRLRVNFNRQSLVFSTGEAFGFTVDPHLAPVKAGDALQCLVTLTNDQTGQKVWSATREVVVTETGETPPLDEFKLNLPAVEGVYSFKIDLGKRPRLGFTTPFGRLSAIASRRVQLVALSKDAPRATTARWTTNTEIDPANPALWDRFFRLPQFNLLPGANKRPLSNGKTQVREIDGASWSALEAGGWQAYPMPVTGVNQPHILEVEIPAGQRQMLGVSIIEPDASGNVGPLGVDTGVFTVIENATRGSRATHRVVFYPRTDSPLVLLTNRSDTQIAAFGKLKVLGGPTELPAETSPRSDGRLVAAHFDKPLFAENFGAPEAKDPVSGRALDDWVTFYKGARRLAEYLKYTGRNAAVVPVLCEGSGLYPSQLLQPTPKFDSGAYFVSGQDARRKDVLEMLLRIFDRQQLRLIPAVQFASTLPALENLRRSGARVGIDLVDVKGNSHLFLQPAGAAVLYNPLDDRVQTAMADVVDELASRCAGHSSFAGVSVQLGAGYYSQLPGIDWGYDDRTVERFEAEAGVKIHAARPSLYQRRSTRLLGEHRQQWLRWRAAKVASLHLRLHAEITRHSPDGVLLLSTAGMMNQDPLRAAMRPTLPATADISEIMLESGISPGLYANAKGIILPRPFSESPVSNVAASAAVLMSRNSEQVDKFFAVGGGNETRQRESAAVVHRTPLPLALPAFDRVSPFGADKTRIWLAPHFLPAGATARAELIHAIATQDPLVLLDGGWTIALGQDHQTRRVFETLGQMPAVRFEDAAAENAGAGNSVIVRSAVVNRLPSNGFDSRGFEPGRYVYMLNNSAQTVTIEFEASLLRGKWSPAGLRSIAAPPARLAGAPDSASQKWQVTLEPYDIFGGYFDDPQASVNNWSYVVEDRDGLEASLRRQMYKLKTQVSALHRPKPLESPFNASFELPPENLESPGWVHSSTQGVTVQQGNQGHDGDHALHMKSEGAVGWARSAPFETPPTGRISMWVWLRVEDVAAQPDLRLCIEGKLHGKPYYKYAQVGAGKGSPRLTSRWQPYVFHVDDLPAAGLTGLRIGFDLMGKGEVWADHVQLYDMWFYDNERDELAKQIAVADFQLAQGRLLECQQMVDGYWPRFLRTHAPDRLKQLAVRPRRDSSTHAAVPAADGTGASGADKTPSPGPSAPQAPTIMQRIRSYLPTQIYPF